MSDKFSYAKSIEEINRILSEIESGELSVDQLSKEVARAVELIEQCKAKLRETEESLKKSFEAPSSSPEK